MAKVQILNSTLKNAQYAFRKVGLRSERRYFVEQLQEVFGDSRKICTKNGKFNKDGLFALEKMIAQNELNSAATWDDMAQILITRREKMRPIQQLKCKKMLSEVAHVPEKINEKQKYLPNNFMNKIWELLGDIGG